MFCFYFFRAFAPIFYFKLQFLLVGAQKYFFPGAQSILCGKSTKNEFFLYFWQVSGRVAEGICIDQ